MLAHTPLYQKKARKRGDKGLQMFVSMESANTDSCALHLGGK